MSKVEGQASPEGSKYDSGKLEWDLLSITALKYVVKVMMFGRDKYSEDNWKLVNDGYNRYKKAALRHLMAAAEGEWLDEESNFPHLAHCICCCLFMLWFKDNEQK